MKVAVRMIVTIVVRERHFMHVRMLCRYGRFRIPKRSFLRFGVRSDAFHRDSRKRLNRKAQCQQQDDEEFAPVRHGSRV